MFRSFKRLPVRITVVPISVKFSNWKENRWQNGGSPAIFLALPLWRRQSCKLGRHCDCCAKGFVNKHDCAIVVAPLVPSANIGFPHQPLFFVLHQWLAPLLTLCSGKFFKNLSIFLIFFCTYGRECVCGKTSFGCQNGAESSQRLVLRNKTKVYPFKTVYSPMLGKMRSYDTKGVPWPL